jgi:TolA-binding protein
LQYHPGVALKEAGKQSEARSVLESLAKQSPASPEAAEAALRWAQCLKEEGKFEVLLARLSLVIVGSLEKKSEVLAAGKKELDEGAKAMREAVRFLEAQADLLKEKQADSPVRARMLYEMVWGYRNLDEAERILEEAKVLRGELPKAEGTRAGGSLRTHEQKARKTYQALIAAFPDLPLANEARLELSELYAERGGHAEALKLLNEALDKEPPAELTDKIRIRLGMCQAALGDIKTALAQFDLVTRNPKSPHAGLAHLQAGECLLRAGDTAGAVRHLTLFRDQQAFRNLEKVTERGLLLLGHAYSRQKQWDQSRQAYEQMSNRFGNSRWADEAQYGMAWAWQNQKQYDNAVNAYNCVTRTTRGHLAANAQLQIGLCRLEQKRYQEAATELLVVQAKYAASDLSSVALVEAARAHAELKQRDQAEKLLRQALRDYPESKVADIARERLQALADGKPFPRRDIAVPAPEIHQPPAVLFASQPQPDRASLEDPTAELSLPAALTASPPERRTPAPFLRLTLPDPFEHRQAIRLRTTPPEEPLPLRDAMTGVLPLLK